MIFRQEWVGYLRENPVDRFKAKVPGCIQSDYAAAHGYGDVNYGLNFQQYKWMEDQYWVYETKLHYELKKGERAFFVTQGIDYEYDIILNDKKVINHEGMFSSVEVDITDFLTADNVLRVVIYPMPKYNNGTDVEDRCQAVDSCKPAVGYGWDWHPRLLSSGIWCDTYIETRTAEYIRDCEVFYELEKDLAAAYVHFHIDCDGAVQIKLSAPDGTVIYEGAQRDIVVQDPKLWWCNGQGEQSLYEYQVSSATNQVFGKVGFRRIRLVMNEGTWEEPAHFPKTRSAVPITIELNGRPIFAKGSNWVNPEIFNGEITSKRYGELLQLAKDANMNILRVWGGAIVNKESFFDLCDELGIMVWQEFPLACNDYAATPHYLKILEQEAVAIIKRIRRHACHVLWCGGNELFNNWSRMTDQSLALRLLNKLCYENDRDKPFMATSPLCGMSHGAYTFYCEEEGKDVFELFGSSHNTAYCEFGVPSVPDVEYIKTFIPENEIEDWENSACIEAHHGKKAWQESSWICKEILERYFGKVTTLEQAAEYSQKLQCAGYKAIFETARRQKPYCSMAINWCYCEPWKTVANNSLISYPAKLKPAYYAVQTSLQDVVASANIEKFMWKEGEMFAAELWLLNDSPYTVEDTIDAYIVIGDKEHFVMRWQTGMVVANTNKRGNILQFSLNDVGDEIFYLRLVSENGYDNTYMLKAYSKKKVIKTLNI